MPSPRVVHLILENLSGDGGGGGASETGQFGLGAQQDINVPLY